MITTVFLICTTDRRFLLDISPNEEMEVVADLSREGSKTSVPEFWQVSTEQAYNSEFLEIRLIPRSFAESFFPTKINGAFTS